MASTQNGIDIGAILQIINALPVLVNIIKDILPKPKPSVPVVTPTPAPNSPNDFPDDTIPIPSKPRTVVTVDCKLGRVQYSRQRFPQEYTSENPFGLAKPGPIQSGAEAMAWGSKFWLDLTARDANGKELLREDILTAGIAFKTEHHAGEAFIKGHGANADGSAKAGYETNDTDEIGNGITAWLSTNGFLHQMKAFGEGTFLCYGVVNGVKSNEFTIRVS
jgi:hypothetical protein